MEYTIAVLRIKCKKNPHTPCLLITFSQAITIYQLRRILHTLFDFFGKIIHATRVNSEAQSSCQISETN